MLRVYERGLNWALDHRRIMMALTLATIFVNVILFILVPKGLFPQQDTGLIMGTSEASQDVSFLGMKAHEEAISKIILADPDVAHMISFIGAANGTAGNTGTMFIDLKPHEERVATADDIINRLRPKLAKLPGVRLYLQSAQDVRVGGRSSRTQYQFTLQDANLDELNKWAPKVYDAFRALPQLKDVASDQQTSGVQANVNIDRDTAGRLGIYPQVIDDVLYDAFGQRQVSTIFTQQNQYHVIMEIKPAYQLGVESLQKLYVPSATTGGPVPMSQIASFSTSGTSLSINHQGQFPAITISFNLATGVALGDAVKIIDETRAKLGLPAGLIAGFQGTAQAFGASLKSEPYLILAAIITVYIVLGVLYESFVHPITILLHATLCGHRGSVGSDGVSH